MAKINVDNVVYDFDSLSEVAKGQVASLKFVEAEIQRLNAQIAVFQTAQAAYSNALKAALPKAVDMSEVVVGNLK